MYKKMLVAFDGSEGAKRALAAGLSMARIHQAELWALAVEEKLPRFSATIDEVQEEKDFADRYYGALLAEASRQAREAGMALHTLLRAGHAAKTIVEVVKEGAFDLVIVGHTGLSAVWAMVLGSTAERVSRHAPCSVLIVR